ncbi:glycoside hydrolase family 3 N-terminal domain-containing protein [uncultured Eudoraea sp.]|uniref:glycoside hydrolase family 3 N-terminal domain-containing protein n=1 Tax=uncultured Eudoraea sp. TaxID=1035614 RepID=UPI002610A51D|nr:glycoside hydrolase family 3 N-terminal domain-containing protein [uncultured Eudoraea sp.]
MGKYLLSFLFFALLLVARGQYSPLVTSDTLSQLEWVNDKYSAMSLEEKIGQLFIVMASSGEDKVAAKRIKGLIKDHSIGGLIFSRGGPVRQAKLTNEYQSISKIPLLIAMDAEWGLAMRLDSTYSFPWNMTLGAIADTAIVSKVGYQIGRHANRLGVHINFAPDIDINIDPRNPIIGNRSFGEDRENVALKGIAFMKGMESTGVLSCGKHFPGHGDTFVDSHKSMPTLDFTRQRLDSIELYPYKSLIKEGLSSVMVAHLNVPELEPEKKRPSSLSKKIITNLLKNELKFEGLVFTDALNMKGVSDFASNGITELEAFLSGNDILLMPKDFVKSKDTFLKAYQNGLISERRLAYSVKKILMAKFKVGLHQYRPIDTNNIIEDLNSPENDVIYEEAIENAITVISDKLNLIGIKKLENKKIAYVKFGDAVNTPFLETLNKYAKVTQVNGKDIVTLKKKLFDFNLIIIGFHKSNESPWKPYKFSQKELFWLQEISRQRTSNVILTVFAKPYALLDVVSFKGIDGIIMAYQNSVLAQQKAAEILFGAIPAKGVLPVTVSNEFPVNTSVKTQSLLRLGYSTPERVGMSSLKLAEVDRLVQNGLDSLMYPGAQVLIARKGKVIYNKAFGRPTYESKEELTTNNIYDLASLTKILSTLPAIMKMEEDDKIALNDTFQDLMPEYADTELKDVTVLKSLSHYGRLPSWIPFYLKTLNNKRRPSPEFYRNSPSDGFSIKVTENMYLQDAYKDSIYDRIGRQNLKSNRYRYSDVPYYIFKKYIEDNYNSGLDNLMDNFLYKPLGANYTTYNPLEKFPINMIVPSEVDTYYRYQLVQGYVHDMGAAMQGGVGGHAGLFSNANDVAKIMQMYIQGGYYGGDRFLDSRTIEKFNKCYFCDKNVRRGVGFDKPQLVEKGPTCGCVSRKSFGHSGFTGTFTWADPEEEIVYVFLSNRTYPSATNRLLVKSELRTRIQKAIYDSLINEAGN